MNMPEGAQVDALTLVSVAVDIMRNNMFNFLIGRSRNVFTGQPE